MDEFLLYAVLSLPAFALALIAVGAWRSRASVAGGAMPWITATGVLLIAAAAGSIELNGVMLGSGLLLDVQARWLAATCAVLFTILGLLHRRRLVESPGSSALFLLAWMGVLASCLSNELLLFLAGTAVAGYALLGFALTGWQPGRSSRVAALATALIAGDLALLELATLLVEVRSGSFFANAADTLRGMRGQLLVELCLTLGIAVRLAVPLAILAWGRDEGPGLLRTLPGWLSIALFSLLGGWRLASGTGGVSVAAWIADLLWTIPVLLVLLILPRLLGYGAAAMARVGEITTGLRDFAIGALPRLNLPRLRALLLDAESRLTSWSLATSLLVIFAAALLIRALS